MSWAKVKKINSDMSTPLDKLVGRIERYNPGFSGATLSGCELDADGNVVLSDGVATGTVTEDIAVSSLQQWYKYHRNTTEPANTSVSCAITSEPFPYMTAASLPSPYVVSASTEKLTNYAYKAFDGVNGIDGVWAANSTTGWLKKDFGSPVVLSGKYSIIGWITAYGGSTAAPKSWTLDGSNNDSDWTTLDTQTNYTSFADGAYSTFSFTNTTAYRYYRINITANNTHASLVTVVELLLPGHSLDTSVADGDSLSAISAQTYKTIRLVHTLARDSVSDATPKLHYREVSWLGAEIDSKYGAVGTGAGSSANTELSITGGSCVLYSISNDGTAVTGTITRDGVVYQHFTFATGAGCLSFGEGMKCTKSLLVTCSATGKLHINYGY